MINTKRTRCVYYIKTCLLSVTSKTGASGEVPRTRKIFRVTCPTGKVEFKHFLAVKTLI